MFSYRRKCVDRPVMLVVKLKIVWRILRAIDLRQTEFAGLLQ
jgi:hypothetical protein